MTAKKTSKKTSEPKKPKEVIEDEKEEVIHKFDLTDGIGKSDFIAIFSFIYNFIRAILFIIFYPYLWLVNQFKHAIQFLRVGGDHDRPLTPEEKKFIRGVPILYLSTSILGGILEAVIYFSIEDEWLEGFFDWLNLDEGLIALWDAFVWILAKLWGLLVWIMTNIFDMINTIFDFVQTDPSMSLLVGTIVIGALMLFFLLLSEVEAFGKGWANAWKGVVWIFYVPIRIYNKLKDRMVISNTVIGDIVFGREKIENRQKLFFNKIIKASLFGALMVALLALTIGITFLQQSTELYEKMIFFLSFFLILGILWGMILNWLFSAFLDVISKRKYAIKKVAES
ncbi:MAG: hypothetical protein ACTSYA_08590 [Candidatus Kariarchaeaceae archaeon]